MPSGTRPARRRVGAGRRASARSRTPPGIGAHHPVPGPTRRPACIDGRIRRPERVVSQPAGTATHAGGPAADRRRIGFRAGRQRARRGPGWTGHHRSRQVPGPDRVHHADRAGSGPPPRPLGYASGPAPSCAGPRRWMHHQRLQLHVPFGGPPHHPQVRRRRPLAGNLTTLCWWHHHVAVHRRGLRIDPQSPPNGGGCSPPGRAAGTSRPPQTPTPSPSSEHSVLRPAERRPEPAATFTADGANRPEEVT